MATNDTIAAMLENHSATGWNDTIDDSDALYQDETKPKIERLRSYIDHCFETYPIVYNNLERGQVQACVVNWDRRRGQCKYNKYAKKPIFGKRITSKHLRYEQGNYIIAVASGLVGVPTEKDQGVGWLATVRHELGHAIDHKHRGTSDHSSKFKQVMRQFGEPNNDGKSQHGWSPKSHRTEWRTKE